MDFKKCFFSSNFCDTVSPSIVYDHFLQKDKEATERDAMDIDLIKGSSDNNQTDTDKTQEAEKKLLNSAKIMERVLNLNTYEDVARDFRFYEDPADEFRAPEGSLLPLWKFKFEAAEGGMESTHIMWNPNYNDLFGVSLGETHYSIYNLFWSFVKLSGSFSFYNNLQVGYVCIFSLKNPSYPEYICRASSGIISFDIHPSHPNMVTAAFCVCLLSSCPGSCGPV